MGVGFHSKEDHPDLLSPTAELVRDCIFSNGIVMFSKTYCPYCKMAKDVFDSLNCEYQVIELDKRPDGDKIQYILGLMTGARTVPRIFIDGKFIGGGNDVKKLYENGTLQTLVQNRTTSEDEELEMLSMMAEMEADGIEAVATSHVDCCTEESVHYLVRTGEQPPENRACTSGTGGGGNQEGRTGVADKAPRHKTPQTDDYDVEQSDGEEHVVKWTAMSCSENEFFTVGKYNA